MQSNNTIPFQDILVHSFYDRMPNNQIRYVLNSIHYAPIGSAVIYGDLHLSDFVVHLVIF